MADAYREDLAHIHDAGFGALARSAAAVLVEALHQQGKHEGLVVDLGCGAVPLRRHWSVPATKSWV